ncbi:MAG: isoprenyl transferase [Candidatus Omnitrophota bacterium]
MIDKDNIPQHVAIIMDGNGRWAKERGLPRAAGHRAGIGRVREIVDSANALGIKVITFFAFSTENWSRPKTEVVMLMRALNHFLDKELKNLDRKKFRLKIIGGTEPLPRYLLKRIREAEEQTKDNTGMVVVLALNYGSRQEIVEAAKKFALAVLKEKEALESLDIEKFSAYLNTAGLPDPDLLIRTSGEMRISNFLLWQLSYAELYFPKIYWPDFTAQDLAAAVEAYQNRERRFGKV